MKFLWFLFLSFFFSQSYSDIQFYGSLNVGLEYRDLKENNVMDDHAQVQDAFSRVGISLEESIKQGVIGFAKVENSVNIARGQMIESRQTSWAGNGSQQKRVVKVGIKSDQGTLAVGHMWNAYYNAIAAHTDTFSSGWTGFDTYASFRVDNLIAYSSPSYGSFSYAVNIQPDVNKTTGKAQDRILLGFSFAEENMGVSLGYDNQGAGSSQLVGLAGYLKLGEIRLAAKHEIFQEGFAGEDGNLTSMQVSMTSGVNTYKIHVTSDEYPGYLPVDDPDGKASEIKLGVDHKLNASWYVFAEYHQSDEYCAYDVTEGNGNGSYDNVVGNEIYGCKVMSLGSHYSF